MKHIFFFALLAFCSLEIPTVFGGDASYYEQSFRLVKNSIQVLIKHGLCTDENDCNKKQFVTAAGRPWGVILELSDIQNSSAIQEIIGLCIDEYDKGEKKFSIALKGYKEKHEDLMGFAKLYTKPRVELILKGEK